MQVFESYISIRGILSAAQKGAFLVSISQSSDTFSYSF
jgi:hypothetical protein